MKNFSAKTANFQNLKVKDSNVVSEVNLGTAPNQIPLNKDLGSLAYQDAVNLDDVSADMVELRAIAAEISDSAVDVFVYDTSRDSDGGAWRKRTQHASWYNEELNTATRGGRREFPAVALIVAEEKKVTIYDGDDPDLGMWMVFNRGSGFDITNDFSHIGPSNVILSSIHALNSQIFIAGEFGSDMLLFQVKLINDHTIGWFTNSARLSSTNISKRNANTLFTNQVNSVGIISTQINDVAMTILPNAPIDEDTGLPVPTIAVATNGGVSVIKDDGTVVNLNVLSRPYSSVYLSGNMVWAVENPETDYDLLRYFEIPLNDITAASSYGPNSSPALFPVNTKGNVFDSFNYASPIGITKLDEDISSPMAIYITSKYNTGWMLGDIKLAALSDTKTEVIGDLGEELITNGTFDTDVSGWTLIDPTANPDATITWNSGLAEVFRPLNQGSRFYQSFNTVIGREYVVSAGVNGGGYYIADGIDTSSWNVIANDGGVILDTNAYRFLAVSSVTYFILNSTASGASHPFDNISAKQTNELIANGDFSNNTNANDFANTYPDWTAHNAVVSVTGGRLKVDDSGGTGPWSAVVQKIDTVIGKKYILSVEYFAETDDCVIGYYNGSYTVAGTAIPFTNYIQQSSGGTYIIEFTATNSITSIFLGVNSEGISYFDNISVRPAEEDRSVNNNGLQIFGEINKTPVAPGADLVAYSGFSANNYLVQPYNADLDFGTEDFSVMGWAKISNSATGIINIMRNGDTQAKSWRFTLGDANGNIVWQRPDSSAMITFSSSVVAGSFAHYCIIRRSSVIYFYINGKQISSSSSGNSGDDYTSDNSVVKIYGSGSTSSSQYISLWRISATTPTDAQIAKIYRDEKPLFQQGAQATLYGTSDATTALSYDEKTELLHVGTSSGRSDFSGLRRINNTTTAITTSISAHNNLIAEQ